MTAERYPLAPLQRGMLFHALAAPESAMYVEQLRYDLEGDLDVAAFREAWRAACARHAALRTAFDWRDADRPVQVVHADVEVPLLVEDRRGLPAQERARRLRRDEAADRERGFDLARPPLFRLRLTRLDDRSWRLLWTHHHLILDGWSAGLVLRDVTDPGAGAPPAFRDFVAAEVDLALARDHWSGLLAGFTEPTPLGLARGGAPERVGRTLSGELTERLRRGDVPLDTMLAAAWAIVLGRYSATDDVVFGMTVTGRSGPMPGVRDMVGLLINTLPARVRLDRDRPVGPWLRDLHRTLARAEDLAHTPLDRIQAWSEVPAGRRLFDSILVVEDFPVHPTAVDRIGPLRVRAAASVQQTNYPVTLLAYPRERMLVEALVEPGAVDPRLVEPLLGHLEAALDGLTTAATVREVEPLRPPERAELARRGAARAAYPCGPAELVPARFVACARAAPDRIAVCHGDERVTYGELLSRVGGLAQRLREAGVGPGVLVGIYLTRGIDLVVAVLAVACAGGGYVPVDRRHPPARARAVFRDARVAALVTTPDSADVAGGAQVFSVSDSAADAPLAARPGDPAYVIYTSGSTGTPKGVVVEHRQLARLFTATEPWFAFGPDDVWTLFHSIAFDFSVWELWGALVHGGRLVVVPDELTRDPAGFRRLLLAEGVTVLNQTPSAFRALQHAELDASPTRSPYRLRHVVFGGELLEPASLRPWLDRYGDDRPALVNMYGITETTVHVTYRRIGRADLDTGVPSPIGEPIPDLSVRLVDPHDRPVPVGVPGELHVGGAGVARGYLNRPELTVERFRDGWYRTGDRARWLPGDGPSGGLEYLGRVDEQVKVRGHRIEPGEVESVLSGHPLVRESVVVATAAGQLTAYLVADAGLSTVELRDWLAERVPDFLVPAGFVAIDRIPLTPNGKVDRAALPATRPAPSGAGDLAPRTDTERVLADVWAEVLDLDRVGIGDNFFALGGDSILTIQVVSRAGRRGVTITPAQLFAHQSIARLAQVATTTTGAPVEAEQGEVTGDMPATPMSGWFHALDLPHPDGWSLPVLLLARRPVRPDQLGAALTALVAHHDLLRLRLTGPHRAVITPIAELDPVPVEVLDGVREATRRLRDGLDLARGPLLRAAVLREPDRVLLVAHHLVVDAVSMRILLDDLDTALRRLDAGGTVELPAKTTDAGRWAAHLADLARSDAVAARAGWWLDRIPARVPELPVDGDAPNVEGDLGTVEVVLDADLLAAAHRAYRTRPDELLLAALAVAVTAWTAVPHVLVDLEGHGRDLALDGVDVSRTVGWFTTFTPLWLDLSGVDPADPGAVIKAVKEQVRAMPDGGAPYGLARWLRDDDLAARLAELPRAQISVNYLGRLDPPDAAWFALAPDELVDARHPANPRPYLLDLVAGVRDGRLHAYLTYSTRRHTRETMRRLAGAFEAALRVLLDHCAEPGAGGPTPSDFPLAEIDQERLDRLAVERGPIEDLYPLTPLQRGLLFHTLANPRSGVYFEQFSIRLDGPLDVDAFERAWAALLDRHPVLRASIAWQRLAVPHLVVHERVALPLTHHGPDAPLSDLLAADRTDGFDLSRAPLTRLHLIRLAERQWQLVWSHHHIVLDGWSVALLIQEVFDSYEAILAGRWVPAPPPPPYRGYLAHLAGLDHAGAWAHWRRALSGVTGPTPLGADSPRPRTRTGRRDTDYARLNRRLAPDRSDTVREFARAHRLTLDTVLHGAWALLLAHRSGRDDVVFGVTSSGRPPELDGVEQMVGLFINTLPARVRVSRDQPVARWLAALLRDQTEARQFEHTPLDQIKSWTSVPPDLPLFDSGRGLENYPMDGSRFRTGSVGITGIQTFEQTDYALSFFVVPDEALLLQLWYDALQFAPETAEYLLDTVAAAVLDLVADPERTVGEVLDGLPQRAEPACGPADAVVARLVALPTVRDAVVRGAADGRLDVYVVPDPTALDRSGPVAADHVDRWRALYDRTYAEARPADPAFNTAGWTSSYTGGPIDPDAMAEWRDRTLDRIRALRPTRVLEIGCGTGLLLFGLLAHCDSYVGTDISPVCLAQVRASLDPSARVTLLERAADDLDGLEAGFDVVVVNSVVQYLPDEPYLRRVLDAAVAVAAPHGAVVLGDVRHLGLAEAFHVSVQLHRAVDMLPVDELARRVARSLDHERELLVDPAYVAGYAAAHPAVGTVELLPKRGHHDTELIRYRYDAVLRLGPPVAGPADVARYDWHRDVLTAGEIGWLLDHADGDAVGITGVPNARVAADVEAARLLAGVDRPGTVGELRLTAGKAAAGVDPEELYRLAEDRGWTATVTWALDQTDGSVDVLFHRCGAGGVATLAYLPVFARDQHGVDRPTSTDRPLTSVPLRHALAAEVENDIRQALAGHADVAQVHVVDDLPRTPEGRVDEVALPVVEPAPDQDSGAVAPRSADELMLARIWERVLRVRSIGVRALFYDLGGDSMLALQVVDEAARVFGREIPLAALLEEPTVAGMAAALRADPRPWTPLVEITPGDAAPFVCVHPAGGAVLCYAELARLLAPHPFVALQARGVEGDEPPYDDLPAMAARYLRDVRAYQPAGPYLLGGWSMGGLVAYEMAQQLIADGERVDLLALIEAPTPDRFPATTDEAAILARLAAEQVAVLRDRAPRLVRVFAAHLDAVRRYRPSPYPGRTCLVRAAESEVGDGWAGLLTGEWDTVEVPGTHDTVVSPPHAERLAEVLRSRLTR